MIACWRANLGRLLNDKLHLQHLCIEHWFAAGGVLKGSGLVPPLLSSEVPYFWPHQQQPRQLCQLYTNVQQSHADVVSQ